MSSSKITETRKDDGVVEKRVETVDYRTQPGTEAEPVKEKVEVTHVVHSDEKPPGVAAEAATKVAEKLQSVKEAISANKKTE